MCIRGVIDDGSGIKFFSGRFACQEKKRKKKLLETEKYIRVNGISFTYPYYFSIVIKIINF